MGIPGDLCKNSGEVVRTTIKGKPTARNAWPDAMTDRAGRQPCDSIGCRRSEEMGRKQSPAGSHCEHSKSSIIQHGHMSIFTHAAPVCVRVRVRPILPRGVIRLHFGQGAW